MYVHIYICECVYRYTFLIPIKYFAHAQCARSPGVPDCQSVTGGTDGCNRRVEQTGNRKVPLGHPASTARQQNAVAQSCTCVADRLPRSSVIPSSERISSVILRCRACLCNRSLLLAKCVYTREREREGGQGTAEEGGRKRKRERGRKRKRERGRKRKRGGNRGQSEGVRARAKTRATTERATARARQRERGREQQRERNREK